MVEYIFLSVYMRFVTILKSHILLDYYGIVLSIIVQLVQYKFNLLT